MPNKFRLFVDLDGVVADWLGKAIVSFGINIQSNAVREILSNDVRGLEKLIDTKFMWKVIDAGDSEWWESIQPFEWAQYLWKRANELGDACFLTQPSEHGPSAAGKVHWIRKHFDNTNKYLLGSPKHLCASRYSFLIDDTPKKLTQFAEYGGHPVQFPNAFKLENDLLPTPLQDRGQPIMIHHNWKRVVDDLVEGIKTVQARILREDAQLQTEARLSVLRDL